MPVSPLAAGLVVLDPATSRYVVRVRRLGPGAALLAFDPEARLECDAELVDAHPRAARCLLGEPRSATAIGGLPVTLLQCAAKGDKLDRVVRDATALGARRVVVCAGARSVPRPDAAAAARWRRVAIQAARQSGRGDCPEVLGPVAFDRGLAEARGLALALVPGAPTTLHAALDGWDPASDATLLVGPEGGLSPEEVARACAEGFLPAALGPFVLRTETAATAALAVLASRGPLE